MGPAASRVHRRVRAGPRAAPRAGEAAPVGRVGDQVVAQRGGGPQHGDQPLPQRRVGRRRRRGPGPAGGLDQPVQLPRGEVRIGRAGHPVVQTQVEQAHAQAEEARALVERAEAGEEGIDHWLAQQRLRHAENKLSVAGKG